MRILKTRATWVLISFGAALAFAATSTSAELEPMSVRVMTRGYFFALSRIQDTKALGGFARQGELSKEIPSGLSYRQGELALVALPEETVPFRNRYRGMRVLLINGTSEPAAFRASDSRLSIIQEARDENGEWKPIEYLPGSWCGNSRHTVFLEPGHLWEFAAARYSGSLETRLRFRLSLRDDRVLYSNEFRGSINPEQLTVQEGHTPTGIMDPYND